MLENKKQAEGIIRNHVLLSMGAGAIPIPLADISAVLALQLDMIKQLSDLYEIDYLENTGKAFITAIAGSGIARLGASLIKLAPGVGSIIGGISMSVMSGASTYAVGKVYIQYFEKKINLDNIDPEEAKAMFQKEFREGKKVAKNLEKEEVIPDAKPDFPPLKEETTTTEPSSNTPDVITQLLQLGELRDKGIITEEEFTAKKKALMDKI